MQFIKDLKTRNPLLTTTGNIFLALAVFLACMSFITETQVLGINAMIKPLKFALSTWIYAWSMAYLLFYLKNQKRVRKYSILACVVMVFENAVITVQAFRGTISHFNQYELIGGIMYALMGIMIVWLTTATGVLTVRYLRQTEHTIEPAKVLSVRIGLVLFVVFSFFGGYMSVINSHNVGGEMGKVGLTFINWSTQFGDLRVAHFFGIHSLQLIPVLGFYVSNKIQNEHKSKTVIWVFSLLYVAFLCFTIMQAIQGKPFRAVY
jgi:hypothetical protein